jgi:hypothetical protein
MSNFTSAVILPVAGARRAPSDSAVGEWAAPAEMPVEYKRPNSYGDSTSHEAFPSFQEIVRPVQN